MMATRETRILPASVQQVRAVEEDGQKRITGYGVVFDSESQDLGGFFEEIDPKAADRSLGRSAVGGNPVVSLMNHDPNFLLGRTSSGTLRVGADDVGVWYSADVPDTQAGRDAWTLADRGDLDGSSFTFTTPKDGVVWSRTEDGRRKRRVTELNLIELGPVVFPAYLDTTAQSRYYDAARSEYRALTDLEGDQSSESGENDDDREPPAQRPLSPVRRLLRVVR